MTVDCNKRSRHRKFGRALACTLLIVSCCLCLAPSGPSAADSPGRPKRILIFPSYNFDYKGSQWFLQGVMAEFTERNPFRVSYFHENLQLATHPSDRQYMDNMAAVLKIKYSLEKPDLIIVQYMQALQFMERYGKEIFGNVPVVFAGLSVVGYNPEKLPDNYTGIVASYSAQKNIELIVRNHPDVRTIYVVGGTSPVERSLVNEAISGGAPYRGKIEFNALNDMAFPALVATLEKLKNDSVVIYQTLQLDAAGKVFVPAQAAVEIARAANVPVYGMLDTYMGSGVTGGFLIHHEGLGRKAAAIAIQWLESGMMPDRQMQSEPIGSYQFDWRQLKRWGIAEDRLPPGSRIEFKTFSVWDSYKVEIITGAGLIVLQTVLIIGLMWNRYKRIKTEERLGESEEKYRNLFENANEAIFIAQDGRLVFLNPMTAMMIGYTAEEIMAKPFIEFIHPDDRGMVVDRYVRRMKGEDIPHRYSLRIIHRDGDIRWVELSSLLIKWTGKSATLNFVIDITERKQSDEALRESEERYRQLVEYAPAGIYEADLTTGRLLSVNEVLCEYSGYTREELLALNPLDLMSEESQKLILQRMAGYAAGEPAPPTVEYKARSKTGREFWISTNAKFFYQGDRPVRATVVAHDITERKRAEEEKRRLEERLQRAEKMEALGQLAGGVAHDLNNVLGILSGYSELLLAEIPDGHRSRGHVEKILQSTERGAAIIQDLLTLARRGVTVSDVINLNSVVSDYLKTPTFDNLRDFYPRVTFRTECGENLLNIKGSPVHLEKTLMNLVSNAAESISGIGEVTIRTENRYLDKPLRGYDEVKEGDYVVLTVSDTGMGIPPENREKIFEPFYTKKTMGRSGTGLGLAIVWGTVKDHHGYIDVRTEVGEGTTFTLYFPVTREEMIARQQKIGIEQCMAKGESVLVVDDSAEQRDIASRLLIKLGYSVQSVSGGEEAVEYLKGNKADILVLDMIMAPGIDGLETYRRVLEINPKQKAILVSGFSETERVRKAQQLGAGAYVKKPYMMEKIGVTIRKELDRK